MYKTKNYILLGSKNLKNKPKEIFDDNIVDFIDEISKSILKNKLKIIFPEIISFGFWCRKKNILNLKKKKKKKKKNEQIFFIKKN